MPFSRILIAVDGSHGGLSAARLGGEMAEGRDAEVLLVHAVPLPPIVPGVDQTISDESLNYLEETADTALSAAEEVLAKMNVKGERVIRAGSPAEVILSVAEDRDVDIMVVGHRGFGAMKRFILGSVSSKLAHHARCALLLAPVAED
jgi:nucleotide-binding universal stress UspA family protein